MKYELGSYKKTELDRVTVGQAFRMLRSKPVGGTSYPSWRLIRDHSTREK